MPAIVLEEVMNLPPLSTAELNAIFYTMYISRFQVSAQCVLSLHFPFSLHRRLTTSVADPIAISPTSKLSPPYGSMLWASEALAVLGVVEPMVVLVLVEVPVEVPVEVDELEVAAAVAGREESFASVYHHDLWSVRSI